MKEIYVDDGPFIRTENKAEKITNNILISLIPLIIYAFYKNGIAPFVAGKVNTLGMLMPLIFIIVSAFVSQMSEYLYSFIVKKDKKSFKYFFKVKDSILAGVILALIIPIGTPLWLVALGSLFATIVGKMIFGGLGNNIFNPSLIGKLLIVLIMAFALKQYAYFNVNETITSPIENVYSLSTIGSYNELIEPYGNLWNFLFGSIPGALGTTSVFLCLVGFLYLIYKKAIKWRIPLVYLGTVFIMAYIIGILNNIGIWYPFFHILSGGLVFGAIYLASDEVTSPTTPVGQVIYAIFLGIITMTLRYTVLGIESVLISVLIMNLFVKIIDFIGSLARFNFKKTAILILVQLIIVLGLSLYIAEVKNNNLEVKVNEQIDN